MAAAENSTTAAAATTATADAAPAAAAVVLRFRGRCVTEEDVAFIRALIAAHPGASRWALSKLLCEAWNWRQENGALRDMVCRGLMLALHRAGMIELPPVRHLSLNNVVIRRPRRQRRSGAGPLLPGFDGPDRTPIAAPLKEIRPLEIRVVRRTADESLYDALIEEHHYLGYVRPVGEHVKYVVFTSEKSGCRPVACLAFGSAPRHLGPRDRFIGWSKEARRQNVRFIAYNTRFLILPWVTVRHLASHVLASVARRLSSDWERLYGHPVHYVETFIDPRRFRGTCYRAAGFLPLGLTTGRGHNDRMNRATQPKKEVLGLPLLEAFRDVLSRLP
jgi:hypothetical protein